MYTASTALLEALHATGVRYIFANLGSDHPGILEAMAEARESGRAVPALITCPNEMVAMSAAQGYAQATGQGQAVLVHVECGTQAIGGAIHNAAKARVPVMMLAGASPFTQEGEMRGSRNEFIQWIQDVFDQRGIVRGYSKYNNELKTGKNVKQMVFRAMQFAHSEPRGPVYLMAAREVLEEELAPYDVDPAAFQKVSPLAMAPDCVTEIGEALLKAQRPLVVVSYLGRNPAAVEPLVQLCRRLGVAVLDSVPSYMNFPADDPLYQGNQWNEPVQNPALAEADTILLLESDIPWISAVSKPAANAAIYHIDTDPLKEQMPVWYIAARRSIRADAETALRQISAWLDGRAIDQESVERRMAQYRARHAERLRRLATQAEPSGDAITGAYLTARVRAHAGEDAIFLNEAISNYTASIDHLMNTRPGCMLNSGAGSLGWNGGAAIGVKLANPDRTVVSLTGDGSYMFSIPATVHWIARQYRTPFLQVIYNNRGWKSPKLSLLAVHPQGYASRANEIGVTFDPPPDYAGIAAAAGRAFGRKVERAGELDEALAAAMHAVRVEKRCAVLDVWLPHL